MAHKIINRRNVYNLLCDSNGRDRLSCRVALILGHIEEQHVTRFDHGRFGAAQVDFADGVAGRPLLAPAQDWAELLGWEQGKLPAKCNLWK